jgi:hypothetical protein
MESIDYDRLRSDLMDYLQGAYFVGGFGAALIELSEVESCSDQKLVQIASRYGFNIENYITYGFGRTR